MRGPRAPIPAGTGTTVPSDLTADVVIVAAQTSCAVVDELFRDDSALPCVTVLDDTTGRIGLLMRARFEQSMTGRYGYGRAVWGRRPIRDLADWSPLVLPANLSWLQVSQRLRERPEACRYDDLLVDLGHGRLGRISAAAMFDALAHRFVDRAIHDGLTGVANRAYFLERLTAACVQANEGGPQVLVAFVDLDGMKRVNDTWGHIVGDRLLVTVANQLATVAGDDDLVARLGGDEFAVLCPVPAGLAGRTFGTVIGQRLRQAVAHPDPRLPAGVHGQASVGVAVSGVRADAEGMVARADMAMYEAKQGGGNAVVVIAEADPERRGGRHRRSSGNRVSVNDPQPFPPPFVLLS